MALIKKIVYEIKKRWLSLIFYGLLILVVFNPTAKSWVLRQLVSTGLFEAKMEKPDSLEKMPAVPGLSFVDSIGNVVHTADLKGKVIFINFWASWCPPCLAEMPSLNKMYLKLSGDNRFVFLFFNEDEDKTKALKYIRDHQFSFPLYTTMGSVSQEVFNGRLPTTIVLDKEGTLVYKHEGMADYNSDAFMRQLTGLLR